MRKVEQVYNIGKSTTFWKHLSMDEQGEICVEVVNTGEAMNIGDMLEELSGWSKELIIRFNNDHKWTGLIILNDGFAANWQDATYEDLIRTLWYMGKVRSKKFA